MTPDPPPPHPSRLHDRVRCAGGPQAEGVRGAGRAARRGARRGAATLVGAAALVLLSAGPVLASFAVLADNPVLAAAGDADLAETLRAATAVQGVCYGYRLDVSDGDTGQFTGSYASSSAGAGTPVAADPSACPRGSVELVASITYTSSYSEAEDSASWSLVSSLPGLTLELVEAASGSRASDLISDATSETALLNAVLTLPGLATERAGAAPVVLEQSTDPLPEGARTTGTPGSDWLRQNAALLGLCVLSLGAGLVALVASRRPTGRPAGRPRTFGPAPRPTRAYGRTDEPDPPTDPRSDP